MRGAIPECPPFLSPKEIVMNIFDIMGPIMVGPSSSHTAGAARIGLITRHLLGNRPAAAELLLHGSEWVFRLFV